MSGDERRTILEAVAAGALSPEDAASRLREAERHRPHDGIDAGTLVGTPREDPPPPVEVRGIRIEATAASLVVIGDPDVREAVAEGPCRVRRDGDVLVVEHQPGGDDGDAGSAFAFVGRPRFRRIDLGRVAGRVGEHRLVVRVNRDLPLEVLAQAGSAKVRDVRGPIRCDLAAGSLRIDDFRGPLDCTVHAGSLTAHGSLGDGRSRISCDAGSVHLTLDRGSSVRVTGRVTLGKLDITDRGEPVEGAELVVGEGAGRLDVTATVSNVRIATA